MKMTEPEQFRTGEATRSLFRRKRERRARENT